jgi:plastocyanin
MKRLLLAAVTAVPFVLLPPATAKAGGGCGSQAPEQEKPSAGNVATVRIDHACFAPAVLAVPPNTRITWRNLSDLQHNISGARLGYADLPAHGMYEDTFAEPGFYPYACMIHAGMSGVVHVVSGAARPETAPVAATRTDAGTALAPYAATVAVAGVAAYLGARTSRRRGVVDAHGAQQ